MEEVNTSGHGPAAAVPPEIDRWNWGAFLLNWIWGIGNSTWIALLMFLPVAWFIMPFVLGVRGSAWAWRNKRWRSVEHFQAAQRRWAKWGVIVWLAGIAAMVLAVWALLGLFRNSDAYKLAEAQVRASSEVAAIVGTPLTMGIPMGKLSTSGPSGEAALSFSVRGPKSRGTVFMEAKKDLGQWKIGRMVFEEEGTGRRIELVKGGTTGPVEGGSAGSVTL